MSCATSTDTSAISLLSTNSAITLLKVEEQSLLELVANKAPVDCTDDFDDDSVVATAVFLRISVAEEMNKEEGDGEEEEEEEIHCARDAPSML